MPRTSLRLLALLSVLVALVLSRRASAEDPGSVAADVPSLRQLRPAPGVEDLLGKPVRRIDVLVEGGGLGPSQLVRVREGEPLTVELCERALRELADTGLYADLRAEAEPWGDGVRLLFQVLPRRILERIRIQGGRFDVAQTLRALDLAIGREITERDLAGVEQGVGRYYVRHGYPEVEVHASLLETDEPLRGVLVIVIQSGPALSIERRRFEVTPDPTDEALIAVARSYRVRRHDRADEDQLDEADADLATRLRSRGWHQAEVSHELRELAAPASAQLAVRIDAGPRFTFRFEGNQTFDASQLRAVLELDSEDRSALTLVERLREHYIRYGFYDVEVEVESRSSEDGRLRELAFTVREGLPVRVVAREYPCLTGERTPAEIGSEIDSFLRDLPGTGVFTAVDPRGIDELYGPHHPTGARVTPRAFNPWNTYVPAVYKRATKHLQDLYRSEGYLSAIVGPVQVVRRPCDPRSPPGECRPIGPRKSLALVCRYDELGVPVGERVMNSPETCHPDAAHGRQCEPDLILVVPIRLGPRTILYDMAFEGNERRVDQELAEIAALELGQPVSQPELERARRRLLDAYAEEGYAFASIETRLELSPDHTRARVTFVINESDRVTVSGVVIHGARRTNEGVIRRRVALVEGGPYRRSLVRKTESRLALLGVFSSVTVSLEAPDVPAREKVVIVTVQERIPQSVGGTFGASSGEGPRGSFEYEHRNLGGGAIQLRLRASLSYLPDFLILEQDVRDKFAELERDRGVGARLERRISASVEFPDMGLGPLFRLGVEGLAVRDNSRDFGITKSAGLITLIYRPTSRVSAQLGPSIELNDAQILGEAGKGALREYLETNPDRASLFRVPEGRTVAFAQQLSAVWDRRDNPLGATRGTFASARIEHVRATPTDELGELFRLRALPNQTANADVFEAIVSDFVRFSNRMAGYLPLGAKRLALAMSLGWGVNIQTFSGSQTYPDRLFTLGGVDSMRGFLQDSLIPEDIAQQLLNPESGLRLSQVVVRGGDFFVNPRSELRVPLGWRQIHSAFFVDAGNLWADAASLRFEDVVNPTHLRYTAGAGLRIGTPIGPLVFDYGFNLERVLDQIDRGRPRQRGWEDLGAFHFSIGVF